MARVEIDDAAVEAERGAVLAELHGYENDPQSLLFDAVAAAMFEGHPYRANAIGSETDVVALTAGQARAFYRAHYAPANAVLAIVGDVPSAEALELVRRHFGALPARPMPARVAAADAPQQRERRLEIAGSVERQHFELAYPAPAATSPDFAAFLLLQQLLSGGSGVNFRQNDWGTPAVPGSALNGLTEDVATWFIPTADPYLMTITGSLPAGAHRATLEAELDRRIARLRDRPPAAAEFDLARAAVAEQLIFDVETTEDAAHQLAFFEGLGAREALLALPARIRAVTPAGLRRVARFWLAPHRRTIGWYGPDSGSGAPNPLRNGDEQARHTPGMAADVRGTSAPAHDQPEPEAEAGGGGPASAARAAVPSTGPAPPPQLRTLSAGLPAIVQPSPLSPTATVTLLLTAPVSGEEAPADLPGLGTISRSGLAADLSRLIADAREALIANPPRNGQGDRTAEPDGVGSPAVEPDPTPSDDPATRLEQMIAAEMAAPSGGPPAPIVAIVAGAVDPDAAFAALEGSFGALRPAPRGIDSPALASTDRVGPHTVTARIDRPRPQAALGYVVPAPPPATRDGLAWRMLLYILTHDYGGRLGNSAIRDRGLVYHVDSAYRTNGADGWITLATGVDPAKLDAMEAALRTELARLATDPPSEAEVVAARSHLLGRNLSAAQSNTELAAKLARMFVETGGLRSHAALAESLARIAPDDLAAVSAGLAAGTILRVEIAGGDGQAD